MESSLNASVISTTSAIPSTRKIPTLASLEASGKKIKHKGATQIHNIAKQIHEELTEEADIDITSVDIDSLTWMINQYDIARFDNDEYKSIKDIIPKIISDKNILQSFTILDIGSLIRQYRLWRRHLPNVEIFYAVKCNPDPMILRTLANLGVGFDVASAGEINMAIDAIDADSDGKPDRMIYANPCKRSEYISYARSQNVSMMTFDNKNELLKIALLHPTAKLVLRIVVDDITTSKMKFGSKFGCPMYDVKNLLTFAKFHNLNIVGVSFHVGSACLDSDSYFNSIKRARKVFDIAKEVGYQCTILDIGGGFPGTDGDGCASFIDITSRIQSALENFFSDIIDLRVIAEPGRFFAASTMTHVVRIIGKKSIYLTDLSDEDVSLSESRSDRSPKNTTELDLKQIFHYYIDSNFYGVFNNILFDKASVKFHLLNNYDVTLYPSVVFGETCDSLDKIAEGNELPELTIGDYLYVENHGAYTTASASSFNGFPVGKPTYIFTF
jgi:ornithine decarboxylase